MNLRAVSIDDDPTSTLMIKKLSEDVEDLELVNCYNDPVKGAAGVIQDRPDVLFLDIEMPEFTGIDLMGWMVKPPKIVVISANPHFRERAMELNAVAFISKPPAKEEFVAAIEKVRQMNKDEELVDN